MTDTGDLNNLPQAAVRPKKKIRLSAVWIIPLVAALVGLGIAIQRIVTEGPTITIVFKMPRESRRERPSSSTRMSTSARCGR